MWHPSTCERLQIPGPALVDPTVGSMSSWAESRGPVTPAYQVVVAGPLGSNAPCM